MHRANLSVVSSIAGVVSLVSLVPPLTTIVGVWAFPLAIFAVALGAAGWRSPKRGFAIAGILCGSLALLLIAFALVISGFEWQAYGNPLWDLGY